MDPFEAYHGGVLICHLIVCLGISFVLWIFSPTPKTYGFFVDEGPNSDTQQVWRIEESSCFVLMIRHQVGMPHMFFFCR